MRVLTAAIIYAAALDTAQVRADDYPPRVRGISATAAFEGFNATGEYERIAIYPTNGTVLGQPGARWILRRAVRRARREQIRWSDSADCPQSGAIVAGLAELRPTPDRPMRHGDVGFFYRIGPFNWRDGSTRDGTGDEIDRFVATSLSALQRCWRRSL